MVVAAPAIAQPHESRCLFCLRNAMEEGFLARKAEIRAAAKALCFRACTDCKSADECDPDENWIEEALVTLERAGAAQIGRGPESRFRYPVRPVGNSQTADEARPAPER